MENFTLVLSNQELEIVYKSLLEIPAKFSLPVIRTIDQQVRKQEESLIEKKSQPEEKQEEIKNETTTE